MNKEIDPKEPQIIEIELEGYPESDNYNGDTQLSFLDMKKWIEESRFLDTYDDVVFLAKSEYGEHGEQYVYGLRKETIDEIGERLELNRVSLEYSENQERKKYEELKKKFEKEN